ncbi:hypothetical protein [Gluconobacter frateurii]|uniref:DUF4412 domain-containing protein n=1 Tax=Gluconobacter frateurii NRIC 0228 TaxID=1307946 RepID=A0ABQ0Q7K2_9PROT|nr:hypothetical protein [Gluconobacter frateurii]GBR07990.1 hypothetical protein AA0228_0199 [Gluconobacter frateurii NRIC 0228]GLP91234.1 hypothetical protein GCM10007868_23090 [Gluconobacter frateurii]
MRRGFWSLGVLAGLILGGHAAHATDTAPYVTPMHDADIDYVMVGPGGQHLHQRMRWSAKLWRQRVDPEGAATVMLTDYRTHRLMVLDTTAKSATVTEAPGDSFSAPGTVAPGGWKQVGPATIAGESCMIWESLDTNKLPTDFCYTTDGLLLGATQGGRLVVQAASVSRAAQADELFDPPEGYHRIDPKH